jgi:hypothetical protein
MKLNIFQELKKYDSLKKPVGIYCKKKRTIRKVILVLFYERYVFLLLFVKK